MAAGEYVSVSSQADTETADMAKERRELADQPDAELDELTNIYVQRGLDISLARQVAEALTAKDAFATHARDELGLSAHVVARPIQAALTSAVTFAFGAAIPLLIAIASPMARIPWVVSAASLVALAVLGAAGAQTGGANVVKPMLRGLLGSNRDGSYSGYRPPRWACPLKGGGTRQCAIPGKGSAARHGSLVGHARGRASAAVRAHLPGINSLQRGSAWMA